MSNKITGMAKVFYQNYLIDYANTLAVLSGNGASNLYDNDRNTKWQSSGSDDSVTETILVTFTDSQVIDRILLIDMNFKNFAIKYWDGSQYANFTNVYTYISTEDGESSYGSGTYGFGTYATSASDVQNSLNTRYFEFDAVTTNKILIEVTKTMIANSEKYMHALYVGREIGTFKDDLACAPNSMSVTARVKNARILKLSNGGRVLFEKSDKYMSEIRIKNMWDAGDNEIVDVMYSVAQFCFYPCGAVDQYAVRGWRIQDFYPVLIDGDQDQNFTLGRDNSMGMSYSFTLFEQ